MTRAGYEHLTVYRHEGRQAECDLSDNTNLFGSAPSALASLAGWAGGDPARYPTTGNEALRGALASWLGVGPDQVVGGCGSNDILDSAMRALGARGSVLAYTTPTFVMTPHFARANSLDLLPVPSRLDGQPDVEARYVRPLHSENRGDDCAGPHLSRRSVVERAWRSQREFS